MEENIFGKFIICLIISYCLLKFATFDPVQLRNSPDSTDADTRNSTKISTDLMISDNGSGCSMFEDDIKVLEKETDNKTAGRKLFDIIQKFSIILFIVIYVYLMLKIIPELAFRF